MKRRITKGKNTGGGTAIWSGSRGAVKKRLLVYNRGVRRVILDQAKTCSGKGGYGFHGD